MRGRGPVKTLLMCRRWWRQRSPVGQPCIERRCRRPISSEGVAVTVLDRVPVDEISERTRQIHLGRLLLSLIAGFFYVLGWFVGSFFTAFVWCAVAVKVGFVEARKCGSA